MKLLSNVVSASGTEPDPEKVEAMKDFPTPSLASKVRGFAGMASYYRKFVNKFASIAAPLHKFTKDHLAFFWSPQAD